MQGRGQKASMMVSRVYVNPAEFVRHVCLVLSEVQFDVSYIACFGGMTLSHPVLFQNYA